MMLDDLAPPGTDCTTGLILEWQGRYLFAVEPARNWREQSSVTRIRYLGIGGHREPGESWAEAAGREALEEANVRVEFVPCPLVERRARDMVSSTRTFWCSLPDQVTEIDLEWDQPPSPLLVWTATYTLQRPTRERRFLGLVFAARTDDEPRPGAEIPALLALTDEQIVYTWREPASLTALLHQGARLWEAYPIPRDARIEPGGSAQFYAMLAAQRRGESPRVC